MTPPPLVQIRPAGIYGSELVVTDPAHGYQQAIPLDVTRMLALAADLMAGLGRAEQYRKLKERLPCSQS